MEEMTVDKRSKAYKDAQKAEAQPPEQKHQSYVPMTSHLQDKIEMLIANGIPVCKAEFQSAVNNADNVPETHFSDLSDNKNRRAEMWLCSGGAFILCKQETVKKTIKYFGVHGANVKFWHFK